MIPSVIKQELSVNMIHETHDKGFIIDEILRMKAHEVSFSAITGIKVILRGSLGGQRWMVNSDKFLK